MFVFAVIAAVWTHPEPTVFAVLDSLDEEFAHLVGGGLLITLLGQNDTSELLLVPVIRSLLLLLFLLFCSTIRVQIDLLGLALDREIMGELALLALLTVTLFVEDTDNGLGVDAEGNFLDLRGPGQQFGVLPFGILGGLLLTGLGFLLGLFALFFGSAGGGCVDLLDLFLRRGTLLVFHAKSLVGDDLRSLRLLGLGVFLLLRRHGGE